MQKCRKYFHLNFQFPILFTLHQNKIINSANTNTTTNRYLSVHLFIHLSKINTAQIVQIYPINICKIWMLNARFKYARFQLDFFRPISHSNGVLFYQRACLSQYLTPRPQLRFKGNFFPCLYTRPPFSPSLSPPRLTIPPLPMIFTLSCQIFFTLSLLTSSRGETKPYWK